MGAVAYFASVAHYIRLLENGVRIYEWQGNKFLEGIEEREDCQISERDFPGRTIHTKGVVLDGEVAILGSNNMNLRSEKYNSEVMAIVEDPVLAGELNKVFEYDLDQDPSRKILCGNRLIKRPRRVREIHLEEARNFVRKNRFLIELARVFEKFI